MASPLRVSHDRTVFGSAHWSVNVVHVLWDSWVHERDVLIPLGRTSVTPGDEARIVGAYAVLMALVPALMAGLSVSTTVALVGSGSRVLEARCGDGVIASREVASGDVTCRGDFAEVVDALSGRGSTVEQALPGAPPELGFLAAFFTG